MRNGILRKIYTGFVILALFVGVLALWGILTSEGFAPKPQGIGEGVRSVDGVYVDPAADGGKIDGVPTGERSTVSGSSSGKEIMAPGIYVAITPSAPLPKGQLYVSRTLDGSSMRGYAKALAGPGGVAFLGDPNSGRYIVACGALAGTHVYHRSGHVTRCLLSIDTSRMHLHQGVVVDPFDSPLPGVSLASGGTLAEDGAELAVTDSQGRFEFHATTGRMCVQIAIGGYRPRVINLVASEGARTWRLGPGACGTLTVSVTGGRGADVAGAVIRIRERSAGAECSPLALVQADGASFTFDNLRPGEYLVQCLCEGWAKHYGVVSVLAGVVTTYEVPLTDGGAVTCRVIDAEGQPVEGAQVVCDRADIRLAQGFATDLNGKCVFEHVPPGNILIAARFHGGQGSARVRVVDGGESTVEIRCAAPLAIEGRCIDAEGKGVPGVSVQCRPSLTGFREAKRVTSGDDGLFRIAVFRNAAHSLSAYAPGEQAFPFAATEAWPGAVGVVFRVEQASFSSAFVVGQFSGEGLEGAMANIRQAVRTRGRLEAGPDGQMVGLSEGRFRFGPLPAQEWLVWLSSGSKIISYPRVFGLEPGQELDLGLVDVPFGGGLTVRVDGGYSRGVGWGLRLRGPAGEREFVAGVDSWHMGDVPPGAYYLETFGEAPIVNLPIHISAKDHQEVRLVLGSPRKLLVRMASTGEGSEGGQALAYRLRITALDRDGAVRVLRWSQRGVGIVERIVTLEDGRYYVEAEDSEGRTGEHFVTIKQNELVLDLRLR